MAIRGFDHVAIPIQNTEAMLTFYRALGFGVMEREHFYSVHFGDNKINFHGPERWQSGKSRYAATANPPATSLCLGGFGPVAAGAARSGRRRAYRRSIERWRTHNGAPKARALPAS
jgi:catechol 2,3-dioxygenase-like lactoylglutathione lyase family enzyme